MSSRILIVEDEPLIAMMLEDFLDTLGHEVVATCESVEEGLAAVERGGIDAAILDVNLRGESVWPVARKLQEAGVPFILASGGHVEEPPAGFESIPVLAKPYTIDRVKPLLAETLSLA
ncbi:response regulator [Sphingomicrobium nitratireducens]|uniref:response regulator n=1 Tax=Sphingomicrobium nitratireducens TaxID=2964666 RepID=UPI0022401296|nr:response regulator [Sphingomicrobium nitratireducens]